VSSEFVAPAPVEERQRITSLDVLRGFALLGILVMNIQSFSMPEAAYLNPTAYGDLTGANLWVWIVGHLLTDEKMFGLFSILFGAGILLMTSRIEARGERSTRLHYRRMLWLMLFGLLHGHLLWSGDILWMYGVCGLFAFLFRRRSPHVLLISAMIFFAIGSASFLVVGAFIRSVPPEALEVFTHENWKPTPEMIEQEIATFRGGWLQQMPRRIEGALFMETAMLVLMMGWKALGNMLLGMALLKWHVVSGERSLPTYWRMAAAGFLGGLPIVGFGIWKHFAAGWDVRYSFFFGSQFNYWGAILVDVGWIGALMLLCSWGPSRLTTTLGAVGRMAFSNYILQTVICTLLFYGHGLGLFGDVSRVQQISIVATIWIVQLIVSPIWLRHFAFGPLEWLWRSLTYGKRVPIRVPALARAPI
jgi:uncharacterized protein